MWYTPWQPKIAPVSTAINVIKGYNSCINPAKPEAVTVITQVIVSVLGSIHVLSSNGNFKMIQIVKYICVILCVVAFFAMVSIVNLHHWRLV